MNLRQYTKRTGASSFLVPLLLVASLLLGGCSNVEWAVRAEVTEHPDGTRTKKVEGEISGTFSISSWENYAMMDMMNWKGSPYIVSTNYATRPSVGGVHYNFSFVLEGPASELDAHVAELSQQMIIPVYIQ